MPIDILLVEPHKKRREQLYMVLTTTGGFNVKAVEKFTLYYGAEYATVMIPLAQKETFLATVPATVPVIFTSGRQATLTRDDRQQIPGCLGIISIEPIMSVAEKVRQLMTKRKEAC